MFEGLIVILRNGDLLIPTQLDQANLDELSTGLVMVHHSDVERAVSERWVEHIFNAGAEAICLLFEQRYDIKRFWPLKAAAAPRAH